MFQIECAYTAFIPDGNNARHTACQMDTDVIAPYTSGMNKLQLVRRRRLQELVDGEPYRGNQSEFARAIGRSPTIVWRLLAHGDNEKGMGERLARAIEKKLALQDGWLDDRAQQLHTQNAISGDVAAALVESIAVPLLTLEEVARVGPRAATDGTRVGIVFASRKTGPDAFGLVITGTAMSPELVEGDRIICDPDVHPAPGDIVIANVDEQVVLRRYKPRGVGSSFELSAINTDFAAILSDAQKCRIIATMVEHHRYRRNRSST